LLPLTQSLAAAQGTAPAGDPAAGKAYWEGPLTRCRNCHGPQAQGAFGPDLAGRGLNVAEVHRAVRQPWGIMPAFVESQLSEKQIADLTAYFASLPKVAEPGKWRIEVPAGAAPGQAAMINMGCGQCHGPIFDGPRGNLGAVSADYDYFANLVYNHTTALPQHRALLGNNNPNLDMGNYSRARLSGGTLRQIYFWARDEIGFHPPLQGRLRKGEAGPSGVTYTLNVHERRPARQGHDRGRHNRQPQHSGGYDSGGCHGDRISGPSHGRKVEGQRCRVAVTAQRSQGSRAHHDNAVQGGNCR
jgi:cytochrome c553